MNPLALLIVVGSLGLAWLGVSLAMAVDRDEVNDDDDFTLF